MILLIIISLIFISTLYFVKSYQLSLKEKEIDLQESFKQKKVSLFTGILIILIFFVTSDFEFISISDKIIEHFALSNNLVILKNKIWSLLTHSFIHKDLFHLSVNLIAIVFLSKYETRVGSSRFMRVLIISLIGSIPSIYLISGEIYSLGISGGLYGLIGAYLTDFKEINFKDWFYKVLIFLAFYIIATTSEINLSKYMKELNIDYLGHLFGGLTGIFLCKIFPENKFE